MHRVQRVPATEKKGRRHSSEVAVVALSAGRSRSVRLDRRDVRVDTYRDTGPGGQHRNKIRLQDVELSFTRSTGPGGQNRNKRETTVVARHRPTGMVVRASEERTQGRNREIALARLAERLVEAEASRSQQVVDSERSSQISGRERQFTWTGWRDEVKGPGGVRGSMSRILAGRLEPLLRHTTGA